MWINLTIVLCLLVFCAGCEKNALLKDEVIDVPDLITLLIEGDFGYVTTIIENYQRIYEADPARELHVVVPYRQFIDAASYQKDKRALIESRLEEWEHHSVDSFAPYMAMCSFSYGLASRTRGESNLVDLRLHCRHAIKLNPKLPYAYGRLIQAARWDENRKEADNWLQSGLSIAPESYFVRSAYQSLLSPKHGGTNEELLAYAEQAQKYAKTNPMLVKLLSDAQDNIGTQHFRNGDYMKAIASYKQSLEYYVWGNPLVSMAAAWTRLGENDRAIEALTHAIEIRTEAYYLFERRARANSDAKYFKEAFADINMALSEEPENSTFLRTKADILYDMKDYPAALAGYESLVETGKATARDWRKIAYIKQRKIIDIEAAEYGYTRALAMDPLNAWAWHAFSTLLYNNKDPRAPSAFKRYLDLCATGKACDQVLVDRSKRFLDCINSVPGCNLKPEEYSNWDSKRILVE